MSRPNTQEADGLDFLFDSEDFAEIFAQVPRPVEPSVFPKPALTHCEITGDPS